MNTHTRRRDDRPADPFRPWIPADKPPPDFDADRRRNRSATLPSHAYDPRSHPPRDTRYNDPRQASRPHRPDPHYPPAPSHHPSVHPPSTSRAYQHATRPSAQHSSSTHHYPQPPSYQPPQPTPAYQVASSSRRPHPEPSDPRPSRRPHQPPYDPPSGAEDLQRTSARSRAVHSSMQPSYSAPANQASWNLPQDVRRHRDAYKDRDRDQDRERDRDRERDKPIAEPENRYKDRPKADRPRERERERATDVRYQDSSRSRHHDKRKESDTEGGPYSEQRNTSRASLSGREGHPSSVREPANGHRRHRTEDGTASTARRHQPENTQNPITAMTSHSTSVPQPDVQQTGEPPPAPRVMPVYLAPKAKSQRSHREGRQSTPHGAQSGSDTERPTGKHRMDRTPSGPAVQRSDGHTSSSARDRVNHDLPMSSRDDVKKPEGKYGVHQDTRQPLAPINVDIPLVTPGFNASALPAETRAPQIVSIRAGQGPSDPHDVHSKSSAISHSDAPQGIAFHPHPTSASIVKSSSHTRTHSSETRALPDRPPVVVENTRTEPHGDDTPPGQRVSIHESGRASSVSKSYARGNPETGVDNPSSSYPHSRPPSRSAHRTSFNNTVPPAVVGPRPLRSVSQGPQTNELPTRPPSVAHQVSTASSAPNQHSYPPSPAHPANDSPPKAGHIHGSLSSTQPSPKYAQLHGVSPSHSTSTQHAPSALPSVHPTPVIAPQTLTASSRPPTRDGTYADVPYTHQQSPDRRSTIDNHPELRQTSNSTAVKASWVVQTPATAKRAKISREDKYLRDHQFDLETPQEQLRQMLSQDDDPFPRASSSMMKASQATTPSTLSRRNSPGTKVRDVAFGTPRGMVASNSPRSGSVREVPTPEHMSRQNLLPHLAGPPQIAVVGATPVTVARDLPQGRVDHSLLAPPFPAPTRVSRTTSGLHEDHSQLSQPTAVRNSSPTSYQPQLAPVVHAPSLFQPYQPPSPPAPEDNGQFSPPPLFIPPPRGPEDSPPPPIEIRTSEIIPIRSQSDGHPLSNVHSVPEMQSEMFHLPSQPSSAPSPRGEQTWQPGKMDSDAVLTTTPSGSLAAIHDDPRSPKSAFAQRNDVPIVHQEIMKTIPVLPSQSSVPPTRPRPKVTIEDVSDDSPVLSKVPSSGQTITTSGPVLRPVQPHVVNANSTFRSAVVDHKSSPQSKNKDAPLHRSTAESSSMPVVPPMPPPTPATSTPTRVPSSAPPTQPIFSPSSQATSAQRATSHTVSSRTYQRNTEMLPTSKLSASAGANPGTIGVVNKSTAALQTTYDPASIVAGQHQPQNVASVQGPLASKPSNAPVAATLHLGTSSMALMTKVATPATITIPEPPVSAPIPYTSASSTGAPPPSAPDPSRHQPSRPGLLSISPLDTTSAIATSTTAVKNAHQEQPIVDSTRPRDVNSSTTRNPPSHTYPASARPGISSATVTPAQPSNHYRTVSLPVTQSSSTVQKPPSPRKYSQPISSTTISTQPFPSRPSNPEPQSTRVPVSGYLSTPAPVRSARLLSPDHMNDSDVLKTPSSIAPSPMLNPDTVPQSIAVPIRERQVSTDSKDDKKKASGLFGIFRTRTLSSKAADPPPVSSVTRGSLDQGKAHPDTFDVPTTVPRGVMSTSVPKESYSVAPPIAATSTRTGPQPKFRGRRPDPNTIPPLAQTGRDHKDTTPHLFTPFKFLTMHSKRNRTVSAASLDVCDGNTATNTVIGSPDHSTVSQAHALPAIIPPDVRDPLVAASEWRDREEADRRERRSHRIRRPGVTFDLEEEPPSPAPGTANRRKKLVRRASGRTPTPGPPRG